MFGIFYKSSLSIAIVLMKNTSILI